MSRSLHSGFIHNRHIVPIFLENKVVNLVQKAIHKTVWDNYQIKCEEKKSILILR